MLTSSRQNGVVAFIFVVSFYTVGGVWLLMAHGHKADLSFSTVLFDVPSLRGNSRVLQNDSQGISPRMLVGIFCTDSENDRQRRQVIRDTYLSYYQSEIHKHRNEYENVTASSFRNRICSLNDLQTNRLDNPNDCQIAYTFVVGAAKDENAPRLLLDGDETKRPMIIQNPHSDDSSESDITYLNIQENMNDGKTLTWFKYASSLISEDDLKIGLIAKMDTDTVLSPDRFLRTLKQQFQERGTLSVSSNATSSSSTTPSPQIYGGNIIRNGMSSREYEFMQGGFFFLSLDLARFVTSKERNHAQVYEEEFEKYKNHAEDAEIGNHVHKFDGPVRWLNFSPTPWMHHADLKTDNVIRDQWNLEMAQEEAKLLFRQLRKQHKGCPDEMVIMASLAKLSNPKARTLMLKVAQQETC